MLQVGILQKLNKTGGVYDISLKEFCKKKTKPQKSWQSKGNTKY